jgi:acyl-homoserine lactone acylase PvdQ
MKRSLKRIAATVLVIAGTTMATRPSAAGNTEILWDRYGVPHIFATNRESMFYAEGWAQMEAQANLLLELYGESRGRAAEYWGSSHVALDRWVQLNGCRSAQSSGTTHRIRPSAHTWTRSRAASTTSPKHIPTRLAPNTESCCP